VISLYPHITNFTMAHIVLQETSLKTQPKWGVIIFTDFPRVLDHKTTKTS